MDSPQPNEISLADFLTWEQQQAARFEWIDGVVVPCAGVSSTHGTIGTNLIALFHAAVAGGPCFVQPSDRQLVPRDKENRDLGSFYADLFISCAPEDRTGSAAHFPTVVVEILSPHIGDEFTGKRLAYLGSRDIVDYLIVESSTRHIFRYGWKIDAKRHRRFVTAEYLHGPVIVSALGLTMTFEQIYAGTNVPAILHPIGTDNEEETEIIVD